MIQNEKFHHNDKFEQDKIMQNYIEPYHIIWKFTVFPLYNMVKSHSKAIKLEKQGKDNYLQIRTIYNATLEN
jgi:hypothetical protein